MTTFTALTTLKGKEAAYALSEALETLTPAPTGIGTFDVEDGSDLWEVGGYFVEKPDEVGLDLLAALHGAKPFAVSRLPDTDWVAQVRRELTPVKAGRFVVHGRHDRPIIPSTAIALEIEAAMAFGTGHHGTTQGCLTAINALHEQGYSPHHIADIGTGTGVLAMGAARLWPAHIIASDIDQVAVATAKANIAHNRLAHRIPCVKAVGLRHTRLTNAAPFDLILANILANPLKRLAPSMRQATCPGALLVLSGILNRQANGVASVFSGNGFQRIDRIVIGEWTTLILRRRDRA